MKAIHYKASVLLAGFLSTFSLGGGVESIADVTGGLKLRKSQPCADGFAQDAAALNQDWANVQGDMANAFTAVLEDEQS